MIKMIYASAVPTDDEWEDAYPGVFRDDAVTLQFLIDEHIVEIPNHCADCGGNVSKVRRMKYQYACTRKGCRHSRSILKHTFFSESKSISAVLRLCYKFICQTANETILATMATDQHTITSWRKSYFELMKLDLDHMPEEERQLGGPNWLLGDDPIVEVDECKLGKRKYNQGHIVEGVWIIGFVERRRGIVIGRFCVEAVLDRGADTIEALCLKYVKEGSCLYSDMWKGYRTVQLNQLRNLMHRSVNHSLYFKDPITGVHTNTIEAMWRSVRLRVPTQCMTRNRVTPYLTQFMWRRRYRAVLWERFVHCLRVTRYDGPVHILDGDDADDVAFVVEDGEDNADMAAQAAHFNGEEDDFMWEQQCIVC